MAGVRGRDGWWLRWHWSSTFFKEERGEKKEEIENGRDGEKRGGDKRERGEGEIWLYRPLALLDACTCYKKWGERERRKEDCFHWPPLHGVLWWLCWALQACITSIVPSSLWVGRKERDEGREEGEREGYNWIAQQLSVLEWSRFTVKVTW